MFTPLHLPLLADENARGQILIALFVGLLAAKLMAEVFERIGQPPVVGEILAGILIGPSLLNWVQPSEIMSTLAEIGVIFLLFTVGLKTRPRDLFAVGPMATLVAVLGVIVPFIAGYLLLLVWPGHSWVEAIFLGAAMVATSVGITARVLYGMGLVTAEASRIILAAAVIDDVIGLLVLAVVSSLASGQVDIAHIALTAALAVGFTLLTVFVGAGTVNRIKQRIIDLRIGQSLFIFALVLCFGLAMLASLIGIAGIVGAFLAGVALSEATEGTELHRQFEALVEFGVPFFLVNVGMQLKLGVFTAMDTLALAALVIVLAILTKFVGCGLATLRMGRRRAIQVGVGMIPRGEVGIVVAQIGLALAAVSDALYGVVLAMSVATTLAAPPLLKRAFAGERATPPPKAYGDEPDRQIE